MKTNKLHNRSQILLLTRSTSCSASQLIVHDEFSCSTRVFALWIWLVDYNHRFLGGAASFNWKVIVTSCAECIWHRVSPRTPEGWRLPSHLSVYIQAANIGPVIYYFLRKYKLTTDVIANHSQLLIGAICCVLLITSWDVTAFIDGQSRSVVLFVCAFGLSLTDCTSSVTFLPLWVIRKDQSYF